MKRYLLLCVVALACTAQQTNTLFKSLTVTKDAPVAGQVLSSVAPNIGQVYHQFTVTSTGGFTCLTTYLQSYVEGSFDNNVWSRTNTFLTNAIFPDSSTAVRSYAAIGLYPYVRIHLYTYSTVNCNYAIQYAGGLAPPSIDIANTFVTYNTTISTNTTLLNVPSPYQYIIRVYGITMCSLVNATQTVTINDGSLNRAQYAIPANDCVVIPSDIFPLYEMYTLNANLSAAMNTSISVVYRYE